MMRSQDSLVPHRLSSHDQRPEQQSWRRARPRLTFPRLRTWCRRPAPRKFDPSRTALPRTSRCAGESDRRICIGEPRRAARRDSCRQLAGGCMHLGSVALDLSSESRLRNPLREICTVGSLRGSHPVDAKVDLNGHEAGNGGHSQGTPTASRDLLYSERRLLTTATAFHFVETRKHLAVDSQ